MSDLLMALANAASQNVHVMVYKFTDTSLAFKLKKRFSVLNNEKTIVVENMDLDNPQMEDELCELLDRAVNELT